MNFFKSLDLERETTHVLNSALNMNFKILSVLVLILTIDASVDTKKEQ